MNASDNARVNLLNQAGEWLDVARDAGDGGDVQIAAAQVSVAHSLLVIAACLDEMTVGALSVKGQIYTNNGDL